MLTAAHCLHEDYVNETEVFLGVHNISDPGPDAVTLKVEKIIRHPYFDYYTLDNDICLVKLATQVNFTDSLQPICLPTQSSTFYTGLRAWVTGFGLTDNYTLPDLLQEVNVPIVGTNQCRCYYNDLYPVTDNMICAGRETGGVDSCQGDSGGPLMTKLSTQWVLIGLVSWGYGCGYPERPGVYTLVSQYEDWVKDNVTGSDVGFLTFTSSGIDLDSMFVCPTTVAPSTTLYYETTEYDDSIFGSGENLMHFTHVFSVCAVGLLLHVLVGAAM